jgi:hypothetical protein
MHVLHTPYLLIATVEVIGRYVLWGLDFDTFLRVRNAHFCQLG